MYCQGQVLLDMNWFVQHGVQTALPLPTRRTCAVHRAPRFMGGTYMCVCVCALMKAFIKDALLESGTTTEKRLKPTDGSES